MKLLFRSARDSRARRAMFLFAVFAATTASAAQFLNGDFENDLGGPFGGWTLPKVGVYHVEDRAGINGTRGLVFSTDDREAPYRWARQEVSVQPGRTYAYSAKIRTTKLKCETAGASIFINWRTPDGKNREFWGMPPIRGDNSNWALCNGTVTVPEGVSNLWVNLIVSRHTTGKACFDDVIFEPITTRVVSFVGTDAYRQTAAEGPLTLSGAFDGKNLPPPEKLSFEFTYRGADGKPVTRPAGKVERYAARLTIDAGRDLAEGKGPLVFAIREKATGAVLGAATNELNRVRVLPKRKVELDRHGRLIVEGKPFFPLGFYCSVVDEQLLGHLKGTPFNVLMPYCHPVDRRPFDLAEAAGVKLIYHFIDYFVGCRHAPSIKTVEDERAAIFKWAKEFRDHPALLAWYMSDEKTILSIPAMERHQRWLEELDPEHPTWTCVVPLEAEEVGRYLGCSDVIGSDPYPIGRAADVKIGSCAVSARATVSAAKGMRGVWQIPQVFDWGVINSNTVKECGARAPTREEMSNMYWQHIAEGANGVIAYTLNEKSLTGNGHTFADRWQDIVAVGREIKAKEEILLSVEPAPAVVSAPAGVSVRVWRLKGKLHILAVNATREPRSGEIVLSDSTRHAITLSPLEISWL